MWQWFLIQTMRYIIGHDVFSKIQSLVATVATDETLSGSEKREKVLDAAKSISEDYASHMLNLAIEASVVLLKSK